MNQRDQMQRGGRAKVKQKRNDPKRWPTYALMFICGLLLVAGFFLAGRQHFSSMDTGMKNSRLRKQVDELEAEKRRLLLTREVSLSPSEIKKAAKKTGLAEQSTAEPETIQIASVTKDRTSQSAQITTKPMVVKTAAVEPARPSTAAVLSKATKLISQARKPLSTE